MTSASAFAEVEVIVLYCLQASLLDAAEQKA